MIWLFFTCMYGCLLLGVQVKVVASSMLSSASCRDGSHSSNSSSCARHPLYKKKPPNITAAVATMSQSLRNFPMAKPSYQTQARPLGQSPHTHHSYSQSRHSPPTARCTASPHKELPVSFLIWIAPAMFPSNRLIWTAFLGLTLSCRARVISGSC